MIDDANKRFYRRCDEFAICVNIGKEGYVTAESPEDRNTIFQYIVYYYLSKIEYLLQLLFVQ